MMWQVLTSFPNSFYDLEFPQRNAIATAILNAWKSINLHLEVIVFSVIMLLSIYFTLTTTNSFHCGNPPIADFFHDQIICITDCENITIGHSLVNVCLAKAQKTYLPRNP